MLIANRLRFPVAFLTASALCFFSCAPTITVRLSGVKDLSKDFDIQSKYAEAIRPDSAQVAVARKLGLDSFVMARFIYSPKKYYQSWLQKEFSEDAQRPVVLRYLQADTARLYPAYGIQNMDFTAEEGIDTELLFLLGKTKNGTYVVIADQNNNKTLDDDAVFRLDSLVKGRYISRHLLAGMPRVEIEQLQVYHKNKLQRVTRNFILLPTIAVYYSYSKGFLDFLDLAIIPGEYAAGSFRYKGQPFKIAASNNLWPFQVLDPEFVAIRFGSEPVTEGGRGHWYAETIYHVGDTIRYANRTFRIKRVSPHLRFLKIKPVPNRGR